MATSAPDHARGRICAIAANPALDRIAVAPGAAAGGTVRATSYLDTPGGKAVHVAAVARALRGDVELVVVLGGDRGATVGRLLAERGIDVRTVAIGAETRGTYALVDPEAGDVVEVLEPPPALEDAELVELERVLDDAVAQAGVVVASGSLPRGVAVDFYAKVVQRAAAASATVLIDAHGDPLAHALRASPDLVKPNLAEASSFLGRPLAEDAPLEELLAAARALQRLGARHVWLSLGPRGSLLLETGGTATLLSLAVPTVVSAVGCGDAMLGGLAVGLARGWPLLDAARLGVAAAGEKLARADPGLVDGDAAEGLLPSVACRSVA
jgi:1-phosphofructokinase family hexose kinase